MHSASEDPLPLAPGVVTFLPKSGDLALFRDVVTRALEDAQRKQRSSPPRAQTRGPP